MTWQPLPHHEERAKELEAIHHLRWATLVRDCGKPIGLGQTFRCGVRCCPSCAEQVADARGRTTAKAIRQMTKPILALFKITTLGMTDLAATLDLLRNGLRSVRRRKCWEPVGSAVGAYHADLLPNGQAWVAHVHMVLDAEDVLDRIDLDQWVDLHDWAADVERCFREATGGRGKFTLADPYDVHVPLRMGRYLFKPTTCAPPPGKLPLRALRVLLKALHERQLAVHWGSTKRGRRFPRAAPP